MTAEQLRLRCSLKELNGLWYIRFSWYNSEGKRKQTNVSTGLTIVGNKHRAEVKMQALYKEMESKLLLDSVEASKILFSDWLLRWLEHIQPEIQQTTFYGYSRIVNHNLVPYFKRNPLTLAELSRKDLEKYYNQRFTVDKVSAETVKREHANIHSALKWAVYEGIIQFNPSDNLKLPKDREVHKARTYTDEQLNALIGSVAGTELETPILLAAWFGLRRGEIVGVKWDCIDFRNKTLFIRGVVRDQGNSGCRMFYEESAKTKKSIRSFPLSDSQINYFKKLKEKQSHWGMKKDYDHQWDGFVCVRSNGKLISLNTLSVCFPKVCEACGLPRLKLHELRHTNISLMIQNGATIIEASEWAGHSRPSTTANIYAHVDTQAKKKLSNILDTILVQPATL